MPAYLPMYKALSLENTILNERQGLSPELEAYLRQVLELNGMQTNSINSDVMYGMYIDPKMRLLWQEMGIDPDSEDEVYDLQLRLGREMYPSPPGMKRFKV